MNPEICAKLVQQSRSGDRRAMLQLLRLVLIVQRSNRRR